jgi:hypothetical protein
MSTDSFSMDRMFQETCANIRATDDVSSLVADATARIGIGLRRWPDCDIHRHHLLVWASLLIGPGSTRAD